MPLQPIGTPPHLMAGPWPPSPGHMPPSLDEDFTTDDEFDTPLLQENPLTYFLTPPTPKREELEFDFDFDAGIEDSNQPREIVRSISPSTLDGLKKYKPRSRATDCAILDDDDDEDEDGDEEEYIRLQPSKALPFGFEDYFDRPKKTKKSVSALSQSADSFLSPTKFHVGSLKERPSKRFAPPRRPFRGRSQTLTLTRRHSWREPSPDVWSIEEEPDKETMSELGLSLDDLEDDTKTQPIDIPAAKPKKKVRFVLPAKE